MNQFTIVSVEDKIFQSFIVGQRKVIGPKSSVVNKVRGQVHQARRFQVDFYEF